MTIKVGIFMMIVVVVLTAIVIIAAINHGTPNSDCYIHCHDNGYPDSAMLRAKCFCKNKLKSVFAYEIEEGVE